MSSEHFPFDWCIQGAELSSDEAKSAAALAACRTLAEEISELRFPAPRILSFKVFFSRSASFSFVLFNA